MVYVYAKQSELQQHLKKKLSVEQIKETLVDLGMDIKGQTEEKDPELKIEITAEKMDMVSPLGIARAINYYRADETKVRSYKVEPSEYKITITNPMKGRSKTVACVVKDMPMTQEILDMLIALQEKIHDSFGRHRKKASIGIYPLESIAWPISYTAQNPKDIIFRPLEMESEVNGHEILEQHETGKKFAHLLEGTSVYPVFRGADDKVLSMPPIINSHDTGRVEVHHKELFIEVSGENIHHLDAILKVIATTCSEYGGNIYAVESVYDDMNYTLSLEPLVDIVKVDRLRTLIGVDLSLKDIETSLRKMQYGVHQSSKEEIEVIVPAFKSDVWNDVDIIDDVARGYGYNNITPTFPSVSSVAYERHDSLEKKHVVDVLVSQGFLELYTYMLTSTQRQYDKMNKSQEEVIRLLDSADQGTNSIRRHILPEILESLHINRQHKYPQKVFECGWTIVPNRKSETKADDRAHLAIAIADPKANYMDVKQVFDTVNTLMGWDLTVQRIEDNSFIKGRVAGVFCGKKQIGVIGEVAPKVLNNFGLLVPVVACEIDIEELIQ